MIENANLLYEEIVSKIHTSPTLDTLIVFCVFAILAFNESKVSMIYEMIFHFFYYSAKIVQSFAVFPTE